MSEIEDIDDDGLLEGFEVDHGVGLVDPDEVVKNRFYCAGADRKGDDGKKLCNYKAPTRWGLLCPSCGRPYDCKRIKNADAAETKHEMTFAQMDEVEQMQYVSTGIPEVDKVLGGGVVLGKVYLFAGRRGTGKTRLLLQWSAGFAKPKQRVFFSSGEDDRKSIIQFGQTMGLPPTEDLIVHANAQGLILDQIIERMRGRKIKLWMIDSAQTIALSTSDADFRSQEQIGKCCAFLSSFARQANIAIILIGQINEAGEMAGGSALKHGVDALVRFDPYPLVDDDGEPVKGGENVRILWIDGKTRMGSSNVRTYLDMREDNGSLQSLSPRLQRFVTKLEIVR